jgi:hypothetical protein
MVQCDTWASPNAQRSASRDADEPSIPTTMRFTEGFVIRTLPFVARAASRSTRFATISWTMTAMAGSSVTLRLAR